MKCNHSCWRRARCYILLTIFVTLDQLHPKGGYLYCCGLFAWVSRCDMGRCSLWGACSHELFMCSRKHIAVSYHELCIHVAVCCPCVHVSCARVAWAARVYSRELYMCMHVLCMWAVFACVSVLLLCCRCESFNGLMRTQNVYSNRQAPSRDIALWSSFDNYICAGGTYDGNKRYGGTVYTFILEGNPPSLTPDM